MSRRTLCQRCHRPAKTCYCDTIRPIDNPVGLVLLQHPDEVGKAIGTAPILQGSLRHCLTFVGDDWDQHAQFQQFMSEHGARTALLWKTPEGTKPGPVSQGRPEHCIVLDATWRKAYGMWAGSKTLQSLAHILLPDLPPTGYYIRKTNRSGGVSSVEAVYYLMRQLDPQAGKYQPLLDSFEQMQARFVDAMPTTAKIHYQKDRSQ